MKAMVFAAGRGERLRPLTQTIPKALVRVGGRPMIDYPLLLLRHHGIREVIINLHHLGEQSETYLGNGERFGLDIVYSKEPELLDTGGGLFKARAFLDRETFLVINTDVMIDLPLAEAIAFQERAAATATLVLRPDPEADRFGSIEIGPEGRIYRFLNVRKQSDGAVPLRKLMFTGVQILEPRVFQYMNEEQAGKKFGTTKDTYPQMFVSGEPLYGFCFDGFWQDLGTPERIKAAEESLARGEARLHYL